MRSKLVAALVAGIVAIGGASAFVVSAAAAPAGKVTICHRDRNANQPYGPKAIEVNENGALNGHGGHTGVLVTSVAQAQAIKAQGGFWGDVIPPIPGLPNGLNWPAGQSLLGNNCQVAGPPPSSTTTPPSTTNPPSSTTRPPTSSTVPPSTTKPVTPTTKAPTTTTKPVTPTTQAPPPTTRPTPPTTAPPTTTLPKVVPVPGPKAPLAVTGSDSGRVVGVALLMLLVGVALIARRSRPDRLLAVAADAPARPRPQTAHAAPPVVTPREERVEEVPVKGPADSNALWHQFHDRIGALRDLLAEERDRTQEHDA